MFAPRAVRSPALALTLGLSLLASGGQAHAQAGAGSAATVAVLPAPSPAAAEVATTLEAAATATAEARLATIDDLARRGAALAGDVAAFLARDRASSVDERRAVLASIKASVPDRTGKFETPKRQAAAQIRTEDDFDWLAALGAAPKATPAWRDVVADVTALRALAASKTSAAGAVLADAAFASATMIYRDECGRRLRAMAPYSIPALTRESKRELPNGRITDRMRYATYQLERIDRQDPDKALMAAGSDEALLIDVFASFRDTHHREAVYAVWRRIDAEAPRVRAAAREAWLAYVDGPPPPPGRMRHLALPGGKFATNATPVELTYRQLADQELRTALQELFGEETDDKATLDVAKASRRVFAYYDDKRAAREREAFGAALGLVEKGDIAGAVAAFDQLLAADPARPDRAQMVPTYLQHAQALEAGEKWAEAAAAYSKVNALQPTGPNATHALARHHFALGKVLVASGADGSAEFRMAAQLEPADPEVKKAATPPPAKRPWLLYAGGGVGGLAVILLALGLIKRRR